MDGNVANIAKRVLVAVQAVVPAVKDVSIGNATNASTWKVFPAVHQAAAQATIDAFNPADPAHDQADLEDEVKGAVDGHRLTSAIVWTIIDTYSAPATVTKYNAARTKIIAAYKSRPWIA